MLPEVGHFCLILALCLAVSQGLMLLVTTLPNWRELNIIRPLAIGQVLFVIIAFLILAYSFATDDFSVQYVAANSNSTLPIYFKLTAIWGAHEGSLLLWVLILNFWILAVIFASKHWVLSFSTKVITVLSLVNAGLLLLLLITSNPFVRIMFDQPLDGASLNPLLQDFGMIIHPPVLYAGYVGTSIAFAFAIAALLDGKLDQSWAKLARPWVLISWGLLTLGIALGSWWAYYELGWGGWWFWDPVENASFMPWLTCTALIHCLALASKNGQYLRLALFLAIISFALSLLGTFIVRSGIITSVHSFVADPERGMFLLQFLAVTIGGALLLYSIRAPNIIKPRVKSLRLLSIDAALLANNLLLLVAVGTVLLGTLYPLIYDMFTGTKISVGYPYFNAVFIPLMLVLFTVMLPALVPNLKAIGLVLFVSLIISCLFLTMYFGFTYVNSALGCIIALAIICSTVINFAKNASTSKLPMAIAHFGLAITIIGISITPSYEIERDVKLQVGDKLEIANYAINFKKLNILDGVNYIGYQAEFDVAHNAKHLATLMPEKRNYLVQDLPMTETAIMPGLFQDIYIALGQPFADGVWSARVYYKPFVRWIWLGAIIMFLGALCVFIPRKQKYAE